MGPPVLASQALQFPRAAEFLLRRSVRACVQWPACAGLILYHFPWPRKRCRSLFLCCTFELHTVCCWARRRKNPKPSLLQRAASSCSRMPTHSSTESRRSEVVRPNQRTSLQTSSVPQSPGTPAVVIVCEPCHDAT